MIKRREDMATRKLIGHKKFEGQIKLLTGLHIGAGNDEVHIGGVDSEVVRDPLTFCPYIPGSSLKGKMRSLLELSEGLNSEPNGSNSDGIISKLFGDMESDEVTRLVFRDAYLSEESKERLNVLNILPTEEKHENTIDRVSGKANPRNIERAIAGLVFDFEIVLRLFEDDDEEAFKNKLKQGMKLLELDALGGHGSRGYGRIEFQGVNFDGVHFYGKENKA